MAILEESDDFDQPLPVECAPGDIGSIERDRPLSEVKEDRALIDRCLAGDAGAWDELYGGTQPALWIAIGVLLGGGHTDPNLVDEIASRVWFAMIENDGRLLARFDPDKGARLITFLRIVARTEISRHFRRERRRQRRERIALRGKPPYQPADDGQLTDFVDVDGFLGDTHCSGKAVLGRSSRGKPIRRGSWRQRPPVRRRPAASTPNPRKAAEVLGVMTRNVGCGLSRPRKAAAAVVLYRVPKSQSRGEKGARIQCPTHRHPPAGLFPFFSHFFCHDSICGGLYAYVRGRSSARW